MRILIPIAFLLAWTAFAPLGQLRNPDELFEIPLGTWERRMAGDKVDILPQQIVLRQGLNHVLLLRNRDRVPQIFGPVLMMPGQEFRLPFEKVAVSQFDCTAHSSGQMIIEVQPAPAPGIERLAWRWRQLWKKEFA